VVASLFLRMATLKFDREYTEYWESATQRSADGTTIASPNEANHFLSSLGLRPTDRLLDLGCSTGRMCEVLSSYSDFVYGADPDNFAVDKASSKPYKEVRQGTAEVTGYPNEFFDFVFCWGVFDVVDHFDGFSEINRILKSNGSFLITCKAHNYDLQDVLAFKAEKNAFLKGFPNKFTNLGLLCEVIGTFGFQLATLITFPCRGDMGRLNYKRQCVKKLTSEAVIDCYEYLLVGKKLSPPHSRADRYQKPLAEQFSLTAIKLATKAGYASVKEYFESIGLD
jgi:SAM-dependent methyltransferase